MAPIRDAVILAAGYGKRLRPLSFVRPKPLLPVFNRPLVAWTLEYLHDFGVRRVAMNLHHLPRRFEELLQEWVPQGMELFRIYEPRILGTGGGIRNCARHLSPDRPFLVINGDVLTDVDLHALCRSHAESGAVASLALHDFPRFNTVAVESGRIVGFPERTGEALPGVELLAFMGIHLIDPRVLPRIPEGPGDIIDVYQRLLHQGVLIHGFRVRGAYWRDVGTVPDYHRVHRDLILRTPGRHGAFRHGYRWRTVAPDVRLPAGVRLEGFACIGRRSVVEPDCLIRDSILWEGVHVRAGVRVIRSIVTDGVVVERDVNGAVLLPPA